MMRLDYHQPAATEKQGNFALQFTDQRGSDPFLFSFYKNDPPSGEVDSSDALIHSLDAIICEPTPFRAGTHLLPLADSNKNVFVPQEKANNYDLDEEEEDDDDSSSQEPKISKCFDYQETRWEEHFQNLLNYKQKHGDCHIPQNYPQDLALARWARRQRHQYKLKQQNKKSSLSDERQNLLEQAGFIWDPQTDGWEIRRQELQLYLEEHGHCNVSRYAENPQLATWVKRQRRQYKQAFAKGRPSKFHKERFAILTKMGFVWEARGVNSKGTSL